MRAWTSYPVEQAPLIDLAAKATCVTFPRRDAEKRWCCPKELGIADDQV
jgi:hypothetical protein